MKRAGKASPLVIVGIVCAVLLVGVVVMLQGGDSPAKKANSFLTALGRGDVDAIMATSTFGGEPPDAVRKKWELCIRRTEYYRFYWQIKHTTGGTGSDATVVIDMYKNAANPNPSAEKAQIPMVKENGEWLVDAKSIDRSIYPALPR